MAAVFPAKLAKLASPGLACRETQSIAFFSAAVIERALANVEGVKLFASGLKPGEAEAMVRSGAQVDIRQYVRS